ncbi:MAG: hypothetical protein AAF330_04995 [Pseudomonadota bacterium]
MSNDTELKFWSVPPDVAESHFDALLDSTSADQLSEASAPIWVGTTSSLAELASSWPEAGPSQPKIYPGGHRSLPGEWLLRPAFGVINWFVDLFHGSDDEEEYESVMFTHSVPLASTHGTRDLEMDNDEIHRRVSQVAERLSDRISADRGLAPSTLSVPAEHFYTSEDDERLHAADFFLESIVAYWPPSSEGPGLSLAIEQLDGGLPVELSLHAYDQDGHRDFMELLQRVGGKLKPRGRP